MPTRRFGIALLLAAIGLGCTADDPPTDPTQAPNFTMRAVSPPDAAAAPASVEIPTPTADEAAADEWNRNQLFIEVLNRSSSVVIEGVVISHETTTGRYPRSVEPEEMRLMKLRVTKSVRGPLLDEIEFLDPYTGNEFKRGDNLLVYLIKMDDERYFNSGSVLIVDGNVPELNRSLAELEATR